MSFCRSVVPAALALAGCLPTDSETPPPLEQLTYETPVLGGACDVEDVTYRVYAEILREGPRPKSTSSTGSLLVSVSEGTSVVACGEDLVRVAVPGAELDAQAFAASSERVALEVPSAIIGGHRPSIRVAALLDTNDNGECDEGELSASLDADASELEELALVLADEGCPERQ